MKVERGNSTWGKKLHNVENRLTLRGESKKMACGGRGFRYGEEENSVVDFRTHSLCLGGEANALLVDVNFGFAT